MSRFDENNRKVIAEFRENGGVVQGGRSLLILHSTGVKSGKEYLSPLMCLPEGDGYMIIASAGGQPEHPAWYHHLKAKPQTVIEVGPETLTVAARETTGEEHDALYARMVESYPFFAEYQQKAERMIPLFVLEPVGE
jgi:deazaflavin-dependent oxidoreductase (nitroreductase family)